MIDKIDYDFTLAEGDSAMSNGVIARTIVFLPETIDVRNQIYGEEERISAVGISVLDPAWADEIKVTQKILVFERS